MLEVIGSMLAGRDADVPEGCEPRLIASHLRRHRLVVTCAEEGCSLESAIPM